MTSKLVVNLCAPSKNGRTFWLTLSLCFIIAFMIPCLFIYFFPYNVPNKAVFATIIGILSVLVCIVTFLKINVSLEYNVNSSSIMVVVYLVSLLLVVLINFIGSASNVLLNNYELLIDLLRFIPIVLVSGFLPGYFVLKIFHVYNLLSRIERFVYALLLSILITSLIGFFSWNLGGVEHYSFSLLIITNLLILTGFLVSNYNSLNSFQVNRKISFNLIHIALYLTVLCFVYTVYFTIHNVQFSLPLLGDEFHHVGYIEKFLSNYNSWQESALGTLTTPGYPYFFHLFEALSITVSKIPVAYFYVLSSLLFVPLPLFSFVCLSKSLINDRIVTVISAVVFQIFSGFGWIHAVFNYDSTNEVFLIYSSAVTTQDIIYSTWLPTITAPYLIDLAVFLFVLALSLKKDISSKKLVSALIPLLLLGIFVHFEKILMLSGLLLILLVLQKIFQISIFRTKELGLALFTSSVLSLGLDVIASKSLLISSFFIPSIILIVIGFVTAVFSAIKLPQFVTISKCKRFMAKNLTALTLFILLLIVFIFQLEIFTQGTTLLSSETIPFYYLPVKLGTAGLLAIIWLFSLSKLNVKKNSGLLFLLFAVISLQVLLYHGSFTLYDTIGNYVAEFRFIRDITWSILAVAGAIGIFTLLRKLGMCFNPPVSSFLRILVCAFLVSGLVVSSSFSHLLKTQYMAGSVSMPEDDLFVVRFMENVSVPSGSSIYAPVSLEDALYSVTGALIYSSRTSFYSNMLSVSDDVSTVLFTLNYLNVSYTITLKSDSSLLSSLLQYFPTVYSDDLYAVHKLPEFLAPSISADTLLLYSNSHPTSSLLEFGFEGDLHWLANFNNLSCWQPALETFSNVNANTIKTTENVFQLSVEGTVNSKIVAFYQFSLDEPILVDDTTTVFVKFKTHTGTVLMVHVLYDNGAMINTQYNGTVYMSNDEWVSSSTLLDQCGNYITGFRIGVSNLFNQGINKLKAEIESLGAYSSSNSSHFVDAVASLSLANVNYTLGYEIGALNSGNYETIVVSDQVGYPTYTLNELLRLAENDVNVVVIGGLNETGIFSKFTNITLTQNELCTSRIQDSDGHVSVTSEMWLHEVLSENCELLATYTYCETSVPLLLRLTASSGVSIHYVNLWSILDFAKNSDSEAVSESLYNVISEVLNYAIDVSTADVTHSFYLKNVGSFSCNGHTTIDLIDVIFPNSVWNNSSQFGNVFSLFIDGTIDFSPFALGYIKVSITGDVSLFSDDVSVFDLTVNELELLLKTSNIRGSGQILFDSLTSGVPYEMIFENVEYVHSGNFEFSIIPFSGEISFILLQDFSGF